MYGDSVKSALIDGDELSPYLPATFCAGGSRHRLIVAGAVLVALAGVITIVAGARRDNT